MHRPVLSAMRMLSVVLLLGLGTGCGVVVKAAALVLGTSASSTTGIEGDEDGECSDKIDNDGNGDVDCDDVFCSYRIECDPDVQVQAENAARAAKAQKGLGGTYKASCDRSGATQFTLDGDTCSFTCGPDTEAYSCMFGEARGMVTANVRPRSRPAGDPADQLLLRVVDANTLVMDGNRQNLCSCGSPPRLVFKRDR